LRGANSASTFNGVRHGPQRAAKSEENQHTDPFGTPTVREGILHTRPAQTVTFNAAGKALRSCAGRIPPRLSTE
jgi:hypothetical protein